MVLNLFDTALAADYHFNRSVKFTTRYQYVDNNLTVARYVYDKFSIRVG